MIYQSHYSIPIHVKPYVKKYIAANYGDIILISMKEPASIVLYSFLHKENIPFRISQEKVDRRFSELTERICLKIQRRDGYKHGLHIHKENQLLINNYFEQQILERIFQHCEAYRLAQAPLVKAIGEFCGQHEIDMPQLQQEAFALHKINGVKAIEDFCDRYDIELDRDINLEALLKAEYRHRQKKKNMGRFCPVPKNGLV